MRLNAVVIILRKDQVFDTGNAIVYRGYGGFTRFPVDKVPAAYRSDKPIDGYAVGLILRPSQADHDFGVPILFLTQDDVDAVTGAFDKSDLMTHRLLGHGWNGKRPFFMVHDFM